MRVELRHASRTDRGLVREGNEDSLFAGDRILAVADGMGGHVAGEVASREVIAEVRHLDGSDYASIPSEALADAMEIANARLRKRVTEDASLEGMGTTLSALMLSGDRLALLHVGDSRIYRYAGGVMEQLTADDTLVQQLVDEGRITLDEARVHPQRSLLTQALDGRQVQPHVQVLPARVGDRFLLCTDGLSGVVPDELVAATLAMTDPVDAVGALVDAALERGAPDNVSVIVADIVTVPDEPPGGSSARPGEALAAGAAATAVVGVDGVGADASSAAAEAAALGAAVAVAPTGGATQTARVLVIEDASEAAEVATIGIPGAAVVGAATAESAGTLGRQADSDEGDESDHRRRGPSRLVMVLLAALLIVAVGLVMFAFWLRGQWYVGVAETGSVEYVAIYQGVPTSIGPIDLFTLTETTEIRVDDLNPATRARVDETIPVASQEAAESTVATIAQDGLLPVCEEIPDPTVEPQPGQNCREVTP